jgi:CMP/dCMP kinase
MIITISGKPGAGKTTISKLLAKKLKYKEYYVGQMRRDAAKRKKLTIQEYNKVGETDSSTDKEVDKYQEQIGKTEDNIIVQGRTSFKFIPHSFKVYVDVDFNKGAERIWRNLQHQNDRNEGTYKTIEELKKAVKERIKSDTIRYKKYYNLDVYDKKHYDVCIDTTNKTAEEVITEILKALRLCSE